MTLKESLLSATYIFDSSFYLILQILLKVRTIYILKQKQAVKKTGPCRSGLNGLVDGHIKAGLYKFSLEIPPMVNTSGVPLQGSDIKIQNTVVTLAHMPISLTMTNCPKSVGKCWLRCVGTQRHCSGHLKILDKISDRIHTSLVASKAPTHTYLCGQDVLIKSRKWHEYAFHGDSRTFTVQP